jgi:tRNA threonylcarbamoyladenosine biosynthesis protein TsaE
MQFVSHSTQETEQFGEEVAKSLRGGDVLAFTGSLGMGKTAFTRGLARGLGCRGRVTSPTFTIVNEYDGKTPLFHFDMYRLGSSDELFDIGWDDYLARGGVETTIFEREAKLGGVPRSRRRVRRRVERACVRRAAGRHDLCRHRARRRR